MVQDERCTDAQLPPPPPYPHLKKKLYFSPEFFEPHNMADPPPVGLSFPLPGLEGTESNLEVAEEFLFEVRRMIDIAKGRIRSRRYTTSMLTIPEEGTRDGSPSPFPHPLGS